MIVAALLAASLSFDDRVEAERAVERARYAFALDASRPFDEVYPRAIFEQRVRQQDARERVLKKVYAVELTEPQLADELLRIERTTRAPEQLEAILKALGGDRNRMLEVVCRPLLVERVLRGRFELDREVHAAEHRKAREARLEMLAGKAPAGARVVSLTSAPEPGGGLDDVLAKAKSETARPRAPQTAQEPASDAPAPASLELIAALEKQLKQPGDVTTILEDRRHFQVFRLVERRDGVFKVEAVSIPKRPFDDWMKDVAGS